MYPPTHGLHLHNPKAPHFYWVRANGWVVVAMCDLLDVLPREHPGFEPVRSRLQTLLRGIAEYQDGNSGLWHQMLDRNNSYLETSASAMFTYGLARAVNQGWINPTTYGSIALAGWIGVTERVNAAGQVEGTCVGTTLASDQVYSYHRPQSVHTLHGYGPVLLAGAEIIRLLENRAFEIQHKLRTYHFVPTNKGPTCASSRFHRPALPRAWGSGLNERVQQNLRAMDMFLREFNVFAARPHNDLLRHVVASAPGAMEAYALADIGRQYAVFFPRGRYMVGLDPWTYVNQVRVRWLNIDTLSWSQPEIVDVQWEGGREDWGDRGQILLKTPDSESFVALIEVVKPAPERRRE